jgi:hypothetical protein
VQLGLPIIETIVASVVERQEILEHASAQDGESDREDLRLKVETVLESAHFQPFHIFGSQVCGLVVEGLAEVGVLPGPTEHAGYPRFSVSIQEDILRTDIADLAAGASPHVVLGSCQHHKEVPEFCFFKRRMLALAVVDFLGEEEAEVGVR